MPVTPDSVLRLDEVGGKAIATQKDGGNKHHQSVALADKEGAHMGLQANPIWAAVKSAGIYDRLSVDPTIDVLEASFDKWWNNKLVCAEMFNAGAILPTVSLVPKTNSGVQIASGGGANARVAVRTRYEVPQINGLGQTCGMSIRLNSVASPVTGQLSRWGIGDTYNGILVEWDGTAGVLNLKFYRNGSASATIASTAWTVPVQYSGGAGLLKDAVIQHWMFNWNWARNRLIITLDGQVVMDYSPSRTDPLTNINGGRMQVQVTNTSAGASHYIMLYNWWSLIPGGQERLEGWRRKRISFYGLPVASGVQTNVAHLLFRPTLSIGGQLIYNDRIARIRKMRYACWPTTAVATDGLIWGRAQIWKNKQVATGGTAYLCEGPYDPTQAWNGVAVPLVVTVSGTNANNAGYSSTNTVQYQFTVVGARGESIPITGPAAVNVGTPAKQVVISVTGAPLTPGIDKAVAIKIYRKINGAGTWNLIGWADPIKFFQDGFVDDGWIAHTSSNPPGANSQDGDTFMLATALPATVQGGNYAVGGGICETFQSSGVGGHKNAKYADGALNLYPAESLMLIQDGPLVNMGVEWTVEWDEEN